MDTPPYTAANGHGNGSADDPNGQAAGRTRGRGLDYLASLSTDSGPGGALNGHASSAGLGPVSVSGQPAMSGGYGHPLASAQSHAAPQVEDDIPAYAPPAPGEPFHGTPIGEDTKRPSAGGYGSPAHAHGQGRGPDPALSRFQDGHGEERSASPGPLSAVDGPGSGTHPKAARRALPKPPGGGAGGPAARNGSASGSGSGSGSSSGLGFTSGNGHAPSVSGHGSGNSIGLGWPEGAGTGAASSRPASRTAVPQLPDSRSVSVSSSVPLPLSASPSQTPLSTGPVPGRTASGLSMPPGMPGYPAPMGMQMMWSGGPGAGATPGASPNGYPMPPQGFNPYMVPPYGMGMGMSGPMPMSMGMGGMGMPPSLPPGMPPPPPGETPGPPFPGGPTSPGGMLACPGFATGFGMPGMPFGQGMPFGPGMIPPLGVAPPPLPPLPGVGNGARPLPLPTAPVGAAQAQAPAAPLARNPAPQPLLTTQPPPAPAPAPAPAPSLSLPMPNFPHEAAHVDAPPPVPSKDSAGGITPRALPEPRSAAGSGTDSYFDHRMPDSGGANANDAAYGIGAMMLSDSGGDSPYSREHSMRSGDHSSSASLLREQRDSVPRSSAPQADSGYTSHSRDAHRASTVSIPTSLTTIDPGGPSQRHRGAELAPSWTNQSGNRQPARWVQSKLFLHQSHALDPSPGSRYEDEYFDDRTELYDDDGMTREDDEESEEEAPPMTFFYPALLSHVAVQLRDRIRKSTHTRGGLPWPMSFTGEDLVVSVPCEMR